MNILVVGSTHFIGSESVRAELISACKEIGKALAEKGHTIIVGSERENTADRYVVEGANTIAGDSKAKVLVLRPAKGEAPFLKDADKFSKVDFDYRRRGRGWTVGRVYQIMAADGIMVLGGGDGTLEAGLSAPALERPVLPIPSFGGKAEEVWGNVESDYRKINGLPRDFEMLRERWRPEFADLSVRTIEGLVKNNPYRSESYFPQIVLLLLIVLLIATWIGLFVRPFDSKTATFFLMSGISSLLGTGLRTSIQLNHEGIYKVLWRRFLNDMTAGLLLTFGLSLIYLVGGITVTGKLEFVKLTDNDAFQRIAVTMSILGLASGLLIEWASDRLSQLLKTITGNA